MGRAQTAERGAQPCRTTTAAAVAADPSAAAVHHIAGSVAGPGSAPRLAPEQDGAAGRPGSPWPLRATIPASPPSSRAWCCRRRSPHAPAWHQLRPIAPPTPATPPGLSLLRDAAGSTPERKVPPHLSDGLFTSS